MKVVDLHPEELLDKEARGALSDGDRERLDAHLARCATCRAERQLRADFADELGADADLELSAAELAALVEGAPMPPRRSATPEPPMMEIVDERPETVVPVRASSRPRARARIWMVAAAALLIGGAAGATAGVRTWAALSANRVDPTVNGRTPSQAVPLPSPSSQEHRNAVPPPPPQEVVAPAPEPIATPVTTAAPVAAPRAPAPAPTHDVTSLTPLTPAPAPVETSAATLFDDATQARRNGDYSRAILLGRQLQARFPASREAHVSYATVGQLLLDRGDAAGALASFEAYQARGRGELDEAVMVGRATALEKMGRADEARAAWSALLAAFPSSPYAKHVRTRGD